MMKEAVKVIIQVIGWKHYPATEELETLCRGIIAEKGFPALENSSGEIRCEAMDKRSHT
jgi:hypothetical protein